MEVKKREAWLVSISRCFGVDNAEYEGRLFSPDIANEKITVSVSWAMLSGYKTSVSINAKLVSEFLGSDGYMRYVQPAEALSLLGYEVHGTVSFSDCVDENGCAEGRKFTRKTSYRDTKKYTLREWVNEAKRVLEMIVMDAELTGHADEEFISAEMKTEVDRANSCEIIIVKTKEK